MTIPKLLVSSKHSLARSSNYRKQPTELLLIRAFSRLNREALFNYPSEKSSCNFNKWERHPLPKKEKKECFTDPLKLCT